MHTHTCKQGHKSGHHCTDYKMYVALIGTLPLPIEFDYVHVHVFTGRIHCNFPIIHVDMNTKKYLCINDVALDVAVKELGYKQLRSQQAV